MRERELLFQPSNSAVENCLFPPSGGITLPACIRMASTLDILVFHAWNHPAPCPCPCGELFPGLRHAFWKVFLEKIPRSMCQQQALPKPGVWGLSFPTLEDLYLLPPNMPFGLRPACSLKAEGHLMTVYQEDATMHNKNATSNIQAGSSTYQNIRGALVTLI